MTATIGSILQKEREARDLSLAQAAAATRIREDRLRELENDDFSNFPNPAYARMYFRLYCKYLDIQLTDEIDLLFPGALAGLDDYEYLRNEPVAPPSRAARPKPPRRSLAIVAASLLVVIIIVAALGLSLVWTAQRLGEWGAGAYTAMDDRMREARNKPAAPPEEPVQNPEAPTATPTAAPAVAAVPGDANPAPPTQALLPTPEEMGLNAAAAEALAQPALVNTDEAAVAGEPPAAPGPLPSDMPEGELPPQPALPEGVTAETSATPPTVEGETPAPAPAPAAPAEEEKPKPTPFAFPEPTPESSD